MFDLKGASLIDVKDSSFEFLEEMQSTRWLSLDPLAEKYPSISSYNFCNNNPIIYIDVDGRDWAIKTVKDNAGNETVSIKLTTAVMNSSDNNTIDMNKFAKAVKNQVESSYSIKYTKTVYETVTLPSGMDNVPAKTMVVSREISVTVNVQVDVRVIKDENERLGNEHLVKIDNASSLIGLSGLADKLGCTKVRINEKFAQGMIDGDDNNTIVHELGHTLGLRHIDKFTEQKTDSFFGNPQYMTSEEQKRNPNNAMYDGLSTYMNNKTSTEIIGKQIEVARKASANGELNKH